MSVGEVVLRVSTGTIIFTAVMLALIIVVVIKGIRRPL
jgi:hypothetical protein